MHSCGHASLGHIRAWCHGAMSLLPCLLLAAPRHGTCAIASTSSSMLFSPGPARSPASASSLAHISCEHKLLSLAFGSSLANEPFLVRPYKPWVCKPWAFFLCPFSCAKGVAVAVHGQLMHLPAWVGLTCACEGWWATARAP